MWCKCVCGPVVHTVLSGWVSVRTYVHFDAVPQPKEEGERQLVFWSCRV